MKVTENGEIVPNILESLERLDDLTWKLTLREGIKFQNGKWLDGEMAGKAIRRQRSACLGSAKFQSLCQ
jgi:peptide/nickel transport system substrate-binding protein